MIAIAPALFLWLSTTNPSTATTMAVSFGHAPEKLGLQRESESSPEGPGSLAVDDLGRVYVLDAVHARVAVFDKGVFVSEVALGSDTVEDIAVTASLDVVALDRVNERVVRVLAGNGSVVATANVEGRGVDDGGDVTAVFADASGVWVEVARGTQVRVLDDDLHEDVARVTRPGLPFGDGYVRQRLVKGSAQVLFFDQAQRLVDDGVVHFSSTLRLAGLAVRTTADGQQRLFVAAHELVQKKPGQKPERDAIVVVEVEKTRSGLVERDRRTLKASPEFVPLKELVATTTGAAHLYVDSFTQTGAEVTSW